MVATPWRTERGYPAPGIAPTAIVREGNRVLLVPAADGRWALPETLLGLGERVEDSLVEAVRAATGQGVAVGALVAVGSAPERDVRGPVVALVHEATIVGGPSALRNGAAWHALEALPPLVKDHEDLLRAGTADRPGAAP